VVQDDEMTDAHENDISLDTGGLNASATSSLGLGSGGLLSSAASPPPYSRMSSGAASPSLYYARSRVNSGASSAARSHSRSHSNSTASFSASSASSVKSNASGFNGKLSVMTNFFQPDEIEATQRHVRSATVAM
jgi:hypothetical protein